MKIDGIIFPDNQSITPIYINIIKLIAYIMCERLFILKGIKENMFFSEIVNSLYIVLSYEVQVLNEQYIQYKYIL
jgi:hypothetical protein